MRAPTVPGGEGEKLRTVFDRIVWLPAANGLSGGDGGFGFVKNEFADERVIVKSESFGSGEGLEGEIGRVTRAGGADRTSVAANAFGAAIVRTRVLSLRRGPEGDAALFRPLFELDEVVSHRHRGHRVRLRTPIFGKRARLT